MWVTELHILFALLHILLSARKQYTKNHINKYIFMLVRDIYMFYNKFSPLRVEKMFPVAYKTLWIIIPRLSS